MTFFRHDGAAWVEHTLFVHDGADWTDENDEIYADDGAAWQLIQPVDVVTPPPDDFPPPFDLVIESVDDGSVLVSWSLPVSSTPTPTEVQFRVIEISTVFDTGEYPLTTGSHQALTPATDYTFQVRLVHRTDGVADVFSMIAEIGFTTTETEVPLGPFEDPDGSGGDSIFHPPTIGGTAFPGTPGAVDSADCWWEWKIQTYNVLGAAWEDMDPVIEGSYAGGTTAHLFDMTDLSPPGAYRYAVREVCNGTPGSWTYGDTFVNTTDWVSPCADSPISADFISGLGGYEDARFYIPQICTPNVIHDAVTGAELAKGTGFSGSIILSDDGNWQLASSFAFADGAAQKSVVEGGLSGLASLVPGDFSISLKINITGDPIAANVILLSLGGNAIVFVAKASGIGFTVAVETYTTAGFLELEALSPTVLFYDNDYKLTLRWDDNGPKELFINGAQEGLDLAGDGYAAGSISDQLIAYLPANALVTSIAGWDRLLTDDEIAETPPVDNSNQWLIADEADPIRTFAGVEVGDIIVAMSVYRQIGTDSPSAIAFSGGTGVMSATTALAGGMFDFDTAGTSRGRARCDWAVCTSAGTVTFAQGTESAIIAARIRGLDTTTPFLNAAKGGNPTNSSTAVSVAGTDIDLAFLVSAMDTIFDAISFTSSNSLAVEATTPGNLAVATTTYCVALFGLTTATPESSLAGTVTCGIAGGHGAFVMSLNPL